MAYSMFECPKLHNAKSLKFYPEECTHHVSFRHKNLPPDFELGVERYHGPNLKDPDVDKYSIQARTSHKKCPIYTHNVTQNEGDFVPKNRKKTKSKHKTVIEKLEETYWANWKPDKNKTKKTNKSSVDSVTSKPPPEIQVIKSAPPRRRKIRVYPCPDDVKKITNKSQEIQTDDLPKEPVAKEDAAAATDDIEEQEESKCEDVEQEESVIEDKKFLKHTDSFILNVKKQREERREHFDQPKCIRLYKKPGKLATKSYIRGGSYPLKSCLKKDSSFSKGSHRLGRPGSPIIVSSNFSNRSKLSKSYRH